MGFGSTAKTLQKVADMAEDVYGRLNEVRNQLTDVHETARDTRDRVQKLESEIEEQRAILNALAEEQGIDVDAVTADVHIEEAEQAGADGTGDETDDGEAAVDGAADAGIEGSDDADTAGDADVEADSDADVGTRD